MINPKINYKLRSVEIIFKSWKNKESVLVIVWNTSTSFDKFYKDSLKRLSQNKKYRRRTVIGAIIRDKVKLWKLDINEF